MAMDFAQWSTVLFFLCHPTDFIPILVTPPGSGEAQPTVSFYLPSDSDRLHEARLSIVRKSNVAEEKIASFVPRGKESIV